MGKTLRYDPVAKEMLSSRQFRGKVVKPKKGKSSYTRKQKNAEFLR